MAIKVDSENNCTMYRGDTDNLVFSGLPTDKLYSVYFAINNEETGKILKEIIANEFNIISGSASFSFDEDFSNSLPVGEWTYSLKLCYGTSENTVIPALREINGAVVKDPSPMFTVLDMRVEGA